MSTPEILGWLVLIVGLPLNLYVLAMLRRLHHQDPNPVTAVLIIVFLLVLMGAVVFGLIFVNNDRPIPPLDLASTKIITRAALLAIVTIPALSLILVYRGRS